MAGQSFQGNTTTNVKENTNTYKERDKGYLGIFVFTGKTKSEWAMNVRCHSFEYSAYNDMEAHNGTPHMTHEQILQFTILTYIFKGGLFFLKFRFFILLT